jgi:integrase
MTHRPVATAGGPTAGGEPLGPAVASFLAERDLAPSSRRVYVLALHRLLDRVDADTPLAEVSPRMLAEFMTATYPHLAPASYNRVVATLASLFAYTTRQGWTPTSPATGLERRRPRSDRAAHARARAIPAAELLAFLDADHPLREKTLWWLLYETAARAGEVLALNVADLDLAARRAVVVGKGGRAEVIGWETKTARLLPRHLHRRRAGPLFLTDIAPAPARQPALADFDPATGRARLSYRRAAEIFTTAGGGWTLHQLRHSRLTHLAEAGVGLPMLMTKSRHTSLASLAIYAKPTFDAVAAATAALDPDRRR